MASVTVQWIRPKRYEGVIEEIARSRIRGRLDPKGETRAMWRGKPYKVRIVDKGYVSQQAVIKSIPRKSVPKPAAKTHKVPVASPNSSSNRSPAKVKTASPRVVLTSHRTAVSPEVVPSGNTRHRATRRPSLPLTSPMRAGTATIVKAVVHSPPAIARREQPSSSTSLITTPVIEPDSSSSVLSSAHGDAAVTSASKVTPSSRRTPPFNKLDPSVAKYLKDLEKRVVRLEELYKASKPAK